jgi:hypothetical protein
MPLSPRTQYVKRVIDLYRCTPGASGFARRADRCLAAALYDRHVPLEIVQAALLLAAARRSRRHNDAPPLAPIGSLHYFRPVIDELTTAQPDPTYLRYLRQSLVNLAPLLASALDHQFP